MMPHEVCPADMASVVACGGGSARGGGYVGILKMGTINNLEKRDNDQTQIINILIVLASISRFTSLVKRDRFQKSEWRSRSE